jgi:hypothetical protein
MLWREQQQSAPPSLTEDTVLLDTGLMLVGRYMLIFSQIRGAFCSDKIVVENNDLPIPSEERAQRIR